MTCINILALEAENLLIPFLGKKTIQIGEAGFAGK
jgi:hypothetical protein